MRNRIVRIAEEEAMFPTNQPRTDYIQPQIDMFFPSAKLSSEYIGCYLPDHPITLLKNVRAKSSWCYFEHQQLSTMIWHFMYEQS